mmetsp:Transcript_36352/g.66596  ORF Transcript_36352/g.66596 Transcript_36352/m.66596 type:complete len:208 (-) Transcript_36352:153-776(-)
MCLLGLLRGGNLASADCPDRLVGKHNAVPILFAERGCKWLQLFIQDVKGGSCFPCLKLLANACDGLHPFLDRKLGLVGYYLVGLAAVLATLTVAKDDPLNANVLEHGSRNLSRPGTLWLVPHVLGSHAIVLAQGLLHIREEEEGWGAPPLYVACRNLAIVELTDQLLHARGGAIGFPIATNNELSAPHRNAGQSLTVRAADASECET